MLLACVSPGFPLACTNIPLMCYRLSLKIYGFRCVSISSIECVTHSIPHSLTQVQLAPNKRTPNKGKLNKGKTKLGENQIKGKPKNWKTK